MRILLYVDGRIGFYALNETLSSNIADSVAVVKDLEFNFPIPDNIKVFSFESWTDKLIDFSNEFDVIIFAWWPRIAPAVFLRKIKPKIYNLHPSLLPYGRGKDPNFWALVDGTPFGVSIHEVSSQLDSGPIVAQSKIEYGWEDSGETLYKKAINEIENLFKEFLSDLPSILMKSFENQADYGWPIRKRKDMIEKSHIQLDHSYTGRELLNILRARTFEGHPSAYFTDAGLNYEVRIEIRKLYDS
jgi:methionyl-tRNA formyltransferase